MNGTFTPLAARCGDSGVSRYHPPHGQHEFMNSRVIRRRALADSIELPEQLHPLLRRLYAARNVGGARDLELSLDRLIPVGQLGGIDAAVALLLRHRELGSKIIVVGDFDAD